MRYVHVLVVDMHARPNSAPRGIERRRRSLPASNPELTERLTESTYEETTDDGILDTLLPAPTDQRHRLLEHNDPRHDLGKIMDNDVQ
jgi:hypothetical protein